MACGGFLMFGSCGFFAYAFYRVNQEDYEHGGGGSRGSNRVEYSAAAYTSPDEKWNAQMRQVLLRISATFSPAESLKSSSFIFLLSTLLPLLLMLLVVRVRKSNRRRRPSRRRHATHFAEYWSRAAELLVSIGLLPSSSSPSFDNCLLLSLSLVIIYIRTRNRKYIS